MDQGKRKMATALLAAAALTTTAVSSQALVYTESADAGQTLATAQAISTPFNGTAAGLTGITGTIAGTNGLDADLYSFTLSAASTLRFVSSSTAGIDTNIFLFTSTGVALYGNDDQTTGIQGAFTTGLLAAGTYYFGISLSGNEPVNSANQLLFTSAQPPGTLRTAAGNVNPTTLSIFNGATSFPEGGAYGITISAVPEPSTNAALALGGIAATFVLVRSQRRQKA